MSHSKKRKNQPNRAAAEAGRQELAGNARPDTQRRWTNYLPHIVLALVTFAVYLPILSNGLVSYDDGLYLTNNKAVRAAWGFDKLRQIFVYVLGGNYHPVTLLSLSIDHSLFGLEGGGYHAHSLLLHIANTLLVYGFANMLAKGRKSVAFVTALFFAIHPMHVESVAWLSERKDVLYTFYFLASAMSYLHYTRTGKRNFYLLALALFVVSLLSKPAAVVLPVVLLLVDWWEGRQNWAKLVLEKLPFFVLSLALGAYTVYAQSQAEAVTVHSNLVQRLMFACYGFNMYLLKLLVPFKHSCFYPYPVNTHLGMPLVYKISPFITLAIFAAVSWLTKKFGKVYLFGLLFFAVTIALVLQFLSVGAALMAERYTYVPYIGIFFVAGWLYHRSGGGRNAPLKNPLTYVFAIAAVAYCWLTFNQSKVWGSNETLWSQSINNYGLGNYIARFSRGNYYLEESEEFQKAIDDYDIAISYKPDYVETLTNRARAYNELKQYDKAIEDGNTALKYRPKFLKAYTARGEALSGLGRYDEAMADFSQALAISPDDVEVMNKQAGVYFKQQRLDEAFAEVNKMLRIDPNYPKAYQNRAIIYNIRGEYAKAIPDFGKVIELEPKNAMAYNWRGIALRETGQLQKALADCNKAISMKPAESAFYGNRALTYEKLGNAAAAQRDHAKAASLK